MHGTGLVLLGLVAGYWLLERAEANKQPLKRLGRVIGSLVLTASVVMAVCKVYCAVTGTACELDGSCYWKYKKYHRGIAPAPDTAPAEKSRK